MVSNSASPLDILIWTIMGILSMASLLGNGFITVVVGQQWLRNRKLLTCDFLLISLSTSRFLMQLHASANNLLYLISSETSLDSYNEVDSYIIWLFFNLASLWCGTWLSVFYCVKITNFTNHVFLWLKSRINIFVPRLLGMSIVISSISFLPPLVEYFGHKKWRNQTGTLPGSANHSKVPHMFIFLPLHLTYTCINFSISITASIILLASLWKHKKNLKKSGLGVTDLSTQVHINVIMLLLFYVFFYLLYFTGMILFASDSIPLESTERLIVDILTTSFPSAHSIVLILTNPTLKEMAAHVLNIRRRVS
ncbi:taste receptor type 2 member 60-like [Sceloporus undulatus]|uniref:taste receptor type 2 member 60-like n=1 Tax=Sceloporus undulatus TaxID=8520 RepID=UPI001C4D3B9B|nr:taste receptor type 2 member 60-like [Sceloporus undulatus]